MLNNKYKEYLKNYLGKDIPKKLIYKGTRDGFGANDFHNCCDNKGETIVIIKSNNGNGKI